MKSKSYLDIMEKSLLKTPLTKDESKELKGIATKISKHFTPGGGFKELNKREFYEGLVKIGVIKNKGDFEKIYPSLKSNQIEMEFYENFFYKLFGVTSRMAIGSKKAGIFINSEGSFGDYDPWGP